MMYFKKYWFWFAIMAVLISWTANTWYFKSKQIDTPIFLTHYIEESIGNPTFLTLYYITNKSDHKDLQLVKLDDLLLYPQQHDGFIYMDSDQLHRQNVHQEFTHHYIRKTTFEINKNLLSPQHLKEGIDVKNIEAIFSERAPMTVPIGHIRLLPPVLDSRVLHSESSSSSNDGSRRVAYTASERMTIEEIKKPFEKEIGNEYKIQFIKHNSSPNQGANKTPKQQPITEWPLELEVNDVLITKIQYNLESKNALSPQLLIKGKTDSGRAFQVPIFNYGDTYLEQEDINWYINRSKGDW
ncbi:MAG: hypothetical protein R3328_03420 [Planococcaceae bacterium]|nr:hypothetical protein [Planococcaceae bacterium]